MPSEKDRNWEITWNPKEQAIWLKTPIGQEATIAASGVFVFLIREESSKEWLIGFELPFPAIHLTRLKPHTRYVYSVARKHSDGSEDTPVERLLLTDSNGGIYAGI